MSSKLSISGILLLLSFTSPMQTVQKNRHANPKKKRQQPHHDIAQCGMASEQACRPRRVDDASVRCVPHQSRHKRADADHQKQAGRHARPHPVGAVSFIRRSCLISAVRLWIRRARSLLVRISKSLLLQNYFQALFSTVDQFCDLALTLVHDRCRVSVTHILKVDQIKSLPVFRL